MEVEREAPRPTPTATCRELEPAAACSLLEEMGKWMSSRTTRGRTTMALHGIIRVIAIVKALPQFRVRQHLVRFVHNGHLSLAATLIRVCCKCSPATTNRDECISKQTACESNTHKAFLIAFSSAS